MATMYGYFNPTSEESILHGIEQSQPCLNEGNIDQINKEKLL